MPLRSGVTEFLSDAVNILRSMESFDKAEQFDGFSKVVITVSDEIEYSSGDDTGRTLTLNCPWGTQEIADNILQSIKGFQYQPMTANGALVDPSAEIGDGISANGVYSGIYSQEIKFNSNLPSDISAPSDEEIDEEFPYKSSQERKVERQNKEIRASLSIQADRITQEVTERQNQVGELRATLSVQAQQIEAKVSKEGGNSSSFGWKLTATGWSVYGNGSEKFRIDKDGAYVNGEIRATSGKIGGFDIQTNYLSYNGQTWGGTNSTGAYIGVNGIQLGRNFKVDMQGNLTAASGTFSGNVNAGNIKYGGSAGYLSGGGLSDYSVGGGKVAGSTLGTRVMSGGIVTSLGYADYANEVFSGVSTATLIGVSSLYANVAHLDSLRVTFKNQERVIGYNTITVGGKSYRVLTF